MRNRVYLVGAGPGDPGLITVRGLEILRQADVIIYDYLVDRRLLENAKPGTELYCADELTDKKGKYYFARKQDRINKLLVKKALSGRRVVRLKNGDPFIFGRGAEELETLLDNRIAFAVIPGITAATAAAAFSGIPLTSRDTASSVVFVTGHEAAEKKGYGKELLRQIINVDTIVFYMAIGNLEMIAGDMISLGKPPGTPAAVVAKAGSPGQKIITGRLEDIGGKAKKEKFSPPAIVIIGRVAESERRFNWFRKSKKTLFTGLSDKRYFGKGYFIHVPLIELKPLENTALDELMKNLHEFGWIIFSSRYGVLYFFRRLLELKVDARHLNGIKLAAVGSSTAKKLEEFGLIADLLPKTESAAGLLREFKKIDVRGVKILLPHSNLSDKGLGEGLKKYGASVSSCVLYENTIPPGLPEIDFRNIDEIMFTSPSTVRNFLKRYGGIPVGLKIKTIGRTTTEYYRRNTE